MIKSEIYGSLKWKKVNPDEKGINELLVGGRILQAEIVDYPLTDEVGLYIEDRSGKVFAICFGVDPFEADPEYYIQYAEVPEDLAKLIR